MFICCIPELGQDGFPEQFTQQYSVIVKKKKTAILAS